MEHEKTERRIDAALEKIAERLQAIEPSVDYKSSGILTQVKLVELCEETAADTVAIARHPGLREEMVRECIAEVSIDEMIDLGWLRVAPSERMPACEIEKIQKSRAIERRDFNIRSSRYTASDYARWGMATELG